MKKFLFASAIVLLTLINPSCNTTTDDPGLSDSFLTIVSIEPVPFCSVPLPDESQIYSDDNATFTVANDLRDIDAKGSFYNDVILTGYTISYEFPDGQGSAPSFNQTLYVMVPKGGQATLDLIVVRAIDKVAGYFTPGVDVNAKVRIYGKDVGGEDAQTAATFTINFRSVCGGNTYGCDGIDDDVDGSIDEETLCDGLDDDGDGSVDEDPCCTF